MSFATSLLAMSIHSLAAQPISAAHGGTEKAYANFFCAMSGNVRDDVRFARNDDGRTAWRPDLVVDFGDFQVIVEISSHTSRSQMAFYQHDEAKGAYMLESHHNKVKQALAYAAKCDMNKPTVCFVASNMEFIAFNPDNFNKVGLLRVLSKRYAPSQPDAKAANWVKKQAAFKVIKKQTVESLANFTKDEFITYLRTVAGLPPQEVRLVAE